MSEPPENAKGAAPKDRARCKTLTEAFDDAGNVKASGPSAHTITLPIKPPPRRGEGFNDWLRDRAIEAASYNATPESVMDELERIAGHVAKAGEIKRQIERGFRYYLGDCKDLAKGSRRPKWPERNDELLLDLLRDHPAKSDDLTAISPAGAPVHPLDVLRELHGATGGELLCLGRSPTGGFETLSFDQWEKRRDELPRFEMAVPNLMRSCTALNMEGEPSARCRDNSCGFGGQRFIVVEPDIDPEDDLCRASGMTPPDICASVIMRLLKAAELPLRMVVYSGGKSLHAWFECKDATQERIEATFRHLCLYGADYRGCLPEQQFRLPQGWRSDKGARQAVIYFNPNR